MIPWKHCSSIFRKGHITLGHRHTGSPAITHGVRQVGSSPKVAAPPQNNEALNACPLHCVSHGNVIAEVRIVKTI